VVLRSAYSLAEAAAPEELRAPSLRMVVAPIVSAAYALWVEARRVVKAMMATRAFLDLVKEKELNIGEKD
jgi:hypothetical protein